MNRPMTDKPASEAQLNLIDKLNAERDTSGMPAEGVIRGSRDASDLIQQLLACPMKRSSVEPITVPGMYGRQGLGVFRVKIARASGKPYAMRLSVTDDKVVFEYEAGAIKSLRVEDRWTLDQAKAFGLETGFCCVCGAFLTDPRSVEAGIGPICARKV